MCKLAYSLSWVYFFKSSNITELSSNRSNYLYTNWHFSFLTFSKIWNLDWLALIINLFLSRLMSMKYSSEIKLYSASFSKFNKNNRFSDSITSIERLSNRGGFKMKIVLHYSCFAEIEFRKRQLVHSRINFRSKI